MLLCEKDMAKEMAESLFHGSFKRFSVEYEELSTGGILKEIDSISENLYTNENPFTSMVGKILSDIVSKYVETEGLCPDCYSELEYSTRLKGAICNVCEWIEVN